MMTVPEPCPECRGSRRVVVEDPLAWAHPQSIDGRFVWERCPVCHGDGLASDPESLHPEWETPRSGHPGLVTGAEASGEVVA